MLLILIQTTLFWIVGWIVYTLFLSKETFHQWNRLYLFAVIVIGLVVPFIKVATPLGSIPTYILPTATIVAIASDQLTSIQIKSNILRLETMLWLLYGTGVLITALMFFKELWQLYLLYKKHPKRKFNQYVWVNASTVITPFSFGPLLFWNQAPDKPSNDYILRHELAHIRQWHTADKILIQLLSIVFWWHPMVYLFKRYFYALHEYLADSAAVQEGSKKQYGQLLLHYSSNTISPLFLVNTFIQSPIKNRILMLLQPVSSKHNLWKYLAVLPLFTLVFFACQQEPAVTSDNAISTADKASDVDDKQPYYLIDTLIVFDPDTYQETMSFAKMPFYKKVDQMPVFGNCTGLVNEEAETCSSKAILDYIIASVKYPETARKKGVEGMAYAQFIIRPDGELTDIKIIKKVSPEIDNEVERIIEEMPMWQPGKKDGTIVSVQYQLPVKFKLAN